MSTDIIPLTDRLFIARRDLAAETARRLQAEDAQKLAEEVARRAEERATQLADERDGWRAFAAALTNTHLIDQYATDRLPDSMRDSIIDCLYDDWTHTGTLDGLPVEALVNGAEEEIR